MNGLPLDLVRYQLLFFLTPKSATSLAHTSFELFHTLRHKIHHTEHNCSTDHFIRQSDAQANHIGLYSSVIVYNRIKLDALLQHIDDENMTKLLPLMCLTIACDEELNNVVLPASLLTLKFGYFFDQPLVGVTLPTGLRTLCFGDQFNQSLAGITLPTTLQSLTFGCLFDQPVTGITLPSNLQTLIFGQYFDQSLTGFKLPTSLQHLIFKRRFNQSLDNVSLPSSLRQLTFGHYFNQSLAGITLPPNLRTITFGVSFRQCLIGIHFPPNLVIRKQGPALPVALLPPELQIVYIR